MSGLAEGGAVDDPAARVPRGGPPLGAAIRHRLITIVVTVAIASGLAGFYVAGLQSTYTSSALILLSPAPGNPLSPDNASGSGSQLAVAMDTEAQLVPSAAVGDIVSKSLDRATPDDEGEGLEVTVPPNTQMLEIRFTATSSTRARAGAQGFADAYLEYRSARADAGQKARIEQLGERVRVTESELSRATTEAARSNASPYASQEVPLLSSRLAQVSEALSEAESVSTHPGSVINPALEPDSGNEFPSWIIFLAAATMGVLGGVAIALVREWRQDLVRGTETEGRELTVFSTVDASPPVDGSSSVPGSAEHDAYRRLRAAVIANAPRPHVLAVTAIGPKHSAAVAAHLALVLAEARFSVLLVAPEFDDTSVDQTLGIEPRRGLADVLDEHRDPRELFLTFHGVNVLAGGLGSAGLPDLAASPAFRVMVDNLRDDFDYIIADAGTTGSPDSDAILLAADSVLLAPTKNSTTRAEVGAARERFEQLGVRTLGTVIVEVGPRRTRHSHRSDHQARAVPFDSSPEEHSDHRADSRAHER